MLSGDRHFAELTALTLPGVDAPLYDLTSSSMSRPISGPPDGPNQKRVGDYYTGINFGYLKIDWAAQQLHMQVRDATGVPRIEHTLELR